MQIISPAINIIAKEKPTKLIIQINCFNEADNLAEAVKDLPKKIDGIDIIEVLVVDDGSKDNTTDVAVAAGVHHIVRHYGNKGLPSAVNTGVREAIKLNADILVNTDADRQYKGEDIARLVKPILEKGADFVYGQRMIDSIEHFSVAKKFLQKFGARVVTVASGCCVDDAASGFRAINKHAMQTLFLLSDYASPLENLIQAKAKKLNIQVIDIMTNPPTRPSRIFKSMYRYVLRSSRVIMDNFLLYHPSELFGFLGGVAFFSGLGLFIVRYLFRLNTFSDELHLTLLVASIILVTTGMQLIMFSLISRLLRANRKLSEEVLYRQNINLSQSLTYSQKQDFVAYQSN